MQSIETPSTATGPSTRRPSRIAALVALLAVLALADGGRMGADTTEAQMLALLPDEPCVAAAFTQVRRAAEVVPESGRPAVDEALKDVVKLGAPVVDELTRVRLGTVSRIARGAFSRDGVYFLSLRAEVYDTAALATQQLVLPGTSVRPRTGSPRWLAPIGDESWTGDRQYPGVSSRIGRSVVRVETLISRVGRANGVRAPFPADAVEALAHMMLLRAARQPELTGAKAHAIALTVNGRTVAGGGLEVAGVVYVPVLPYARAAAWSARWDARSGALTLQKTGRPALALRALSAAVNGGEPALKVPLLSDRGQPVMGLSDLVALLGGAAARDGSVVRVRL